MEGGGVFLFGLVIGAVFGIVCASMAKSKGKSPVLGFVLGFFLGIIGLIIMALMSGSPQPRGRGRSARRGRRPAGGVRRRRR
ncbi:MAG: hypothetical protein ACYS9X_02755 [Planctomycetota bacterium]|jgi:ABC-type transport system involved in multi-copper enzyme maturation permease subunit